MNKLMKISILAGTMAIGVSSLAMAHFDDISTTHYYYEPITNLTEKGIINGYPDNTFKPDNKVTRAEFAKMISTAENLKLKAENKITFNDAINHWGKEYIELASSNQLLRGYEDKTFRPNKEITYGEVVTILLRAMGKHEIANDNENWPHNCMDAAEEMGLFNRFATNDLIASNSARRDNVALMIWNMLEIENNNEIGDLENIHPDESEEEKQEKIDTKKVYVGTVEKIINRRGENYIVVNEFNGAEREIKVNKYAEIPDVHTLIMYKISEKGTIKLKKLLTIDDTNKDYFLVEDVDSELIKLEGIEEILDLEIDDFKYDTEKIELDKYDYYLAEIQENDNKVYEFENVEEVEKEDLKLHKKDKLLFDKDKKIAFIIRDMDN